MKQISLLFLSLMVLPCAAQSETGDSLSLDEITVTAQQPFNRLGISFLTPACFVTTTSVTQGNPDLESSGQHNLTLGYSLFTAKLTMNRNLSANLSNDLLTLYICTRGNHLQHLRL